MPKFEVTVTFNYTVEADDLDEAEEVFFNKSELVIQNLRDLAIEKTFEIEED